MDPDIEKAAFPDWSGTVPVCGRGIISFQYSRMMGFWRIESENRTPFFY